MTRSKVLVRSASLIALLTVGLGSGCTETYEADGSAFGGYGETGSDAGADEGEDEAGVGETAMGTFGESGDGDGDGDTQDPECAEISVSVQSVPPTVILLLDQSGSMSNDFGNSSRWNAMVDTLTDENNGLINMHDDQVRFGLALYTSDGGFEGGECPMLTSVAAGDYTFTEIDDLLANSGPEGDTPTGESLQAVAEQMANDATIPGDKLIILATDGEPDTCDQPNPQQGQGVAVAAAQAAFDMGIETRVISVGDDVGASHLQDMANAGRGYTVGGDTDAPYYQALDSDALAGAFDDIITSAVSCTFSVDGTVDMANACEGEVRLDGQALDCGTQWEMVDASTLQLIGDACNTLKDGENHEVDATWSCGVYIP